MLKKIPKNLSPELLKILMEIGHGDEIVIADGNFPAASMAQRIIRLDGQNLPEVLESILQLFPLDNFVENPVILMDVAQGEGQPIIWKKFKKILEHSAEPFRSFEKIERFEFYDRAKKAYAIIATSETALYANIILKKGIVSSKK